MTKKPLIVLVILLGLCSVGQAQKEEISLDLSYGSTTVERERIAFLKPFNEWDFPFYGLGCKYIITENSGLGSAFTGLSLDRRVLDTDGPDRSVTYLKVPIGFHLNYGKKFGIIFGAGMNTGLRVQQDELVSFRDFSFGLFVKAGPAIRISDNYRIILAYQANLDVTPVYITHRNFPGEIPKEYSYKGYDGFILLSISRKIKGFF